MNEFQDLPDEPDHRPVDLPQSVSGTHLLTGEYFPRPPNANAPGDRIYDAAVSKLLRTRGLPPHKTPPDNRRFPAPPTHDQESDQP